MREPRINGVPFSKATVRDLRLVAVGPQGDRVAVATPGPCEDPAVSRMYAAILLKERGQ